MGLCSKIGLGLITVAASVSSFSGTSVAQDAAAGAVAFRTACVMCHALPSAGQNRIGPNLKGVVGRTAGTLAGYSFSTGLKAAGFVWTEAKLESWLAKPSALVPGTKMTFGGVSDATDRANIIAFLKAQD